MGKFYNHRFLSAIKKITQAFSICLFFCCQHYSAKAQCPVNIDFEEGTFNGWKCWSQSGYLGGTPAPTPTAPIPGRHDMMSNPPGDGLDHYGGFPKNCPNGSGHSVKIGFETFGQFVDKVSYTFVIPPGQNTYNLIYHYAIVLNDPNHAIAQQPRFIVEVMNITDGITLPCPLDPIVANGSSLPGFFQSPVNAPNGSIVRCKDWAAGSIKLDNNAGKIIEVSFTATGCGLSSGSHFGYAYVDINSECSSSFTGAVFCPDDAFVNVTGPYGYQSYEWWDAGFTSQIGNTQTINFTPPPPPGTVVKVIVTPYAGYGCRDTLTAMLLDTLTIQSVAGPDKLACNSTPVQLGANPKPGYVYSWTPATGLSNPNIANPIASPAVSTEYIVTTTNAGGGCVSKDTVFVAAGFIDNTLTLLGPAAICPNTPQTVILQVPPTDSIQWYRNGVAIPGTNHNQYNVLQTGVYFARLFTFGGCELSTISQAITVYDAPKSGFTTNNAGQCLKDNQFVFTNSSTVPSGNLTYEWDFGDVTTDMAKDPVHSYTSPGTYTVRLIVTTDNGCKDTSTFNVNVFQMPVAGFNTNDAAQCFRNNQFVFTNTSSIVSGTLHYDWDMGDGSAAINTTNVNYSYASPGVYNVKLVVTSDNGCRDSIFFPVEVFVMPVAGFTSSKPESCFKGNEFKFTNSSSVPAGTLLYDWDMGNGTLFNSQDVTYSYPVPGTYPVRLIVTTDKGCRDTAAFNVTVYSSPVAGVAINNAHQCFNSNQFIYTNTTTLYSGTLQYTWTLGDGSIANTRDVTHGYAQPGVYTVKMLATAAGGCADSTIFAVDVYPYPVADFYIPPALCVNQEVPFINKTINNTTAVLDYLWEFGNTQISTLRHPAYSYPAGGTYKMKLTVNIAQCPQVKSVREMDVFIEVPPAGITYPEKVAIFNYDEQLQARIIGTSVLWTPATSLSDRTSYAPIFRGAAPQLYTIKMKSPLGCLTIDTQVVKTTRRIEIYVPTAFTPGNSNGMNDYLRPVTMGIVKINYFRIYNRWGKMLFQMQGDRRGWDGRVNGKLQELQTLVWMIEAIDVDGNAQRRQGTTVLMH